MPFVRRNQQKILMKLKDIKANPNNPRVLRDDKFAKLKQSISEFPKMLTLRPMVIDENNMILGGNMRLRALQDLGYTEIDDAWVKRSSDLTEEEKQRFIIADNISFGTWDWDTLANDWDSEQLSDWGLDVWKQETDVDYSILDEEDVSEQLSDMTDGVKKAIQIEFEAEHYEEAFALVKYWRGQKAYVGGMIMEYLKSEKDKL